MTTLNKEFDYYLDHQNELVNKYNGRFIVIKDCQVLGDYETEIEAVEKTSIKHEIGTFLVQLCRPGKDNYTSHFHSRVAFM